MWNTTRATLVGVIAVYGLSCGGSDVPIAPDPSASAASTGAGGDGAHGGEGGSGGSTTASGTGGSGGSSMGGLYESGTRIRAKFLLATDGAKAFHGWRDTQLDADCSFLTASDGKTRCLPGGAAVLYFADAGCTQPLASMTLGCAPSKYANRFEAVAQQNCATTGPYIYRVWTVGAKTSSVVYTGSPQSCSQTLVDVLDHYTLGAEVPPSDFVEATPMVE